MTATLGSTTSAASSRATPMSGIEADLRTRLDVPADAPQVMVVTESSHWDPNWLLTSREYFRLCVGPTLDRALDELAAEPRRIYSLECLFYPDLYWRLRPERRDEFRDLVNQGRLRFTGSGVTTPDTLIPEDELLLRDLLVGQEWLRARGMHQEPRTLYLPDSFGHTPGLPSLLAAAGLPYAAVCRIDGMRFPGAELESADHFPVPGSTAAVLTDAGTADFVWRGPDGSEVLAHWHAHGYGHGDMIASGGFARAMGLPTSWPDRGVRHVTRRIERFVDQLTPLARTPYLLLAIGIDFARPIPRLLDVLDTWNATNYDRTGVWLVNAALDDYLDLVATHRDSLPTIEIDPNPYWSGFYSTRPQLKRACRDLGRRIIDVDNKQARLAVVGDDTSAPHEHLASHDSQSPWWTAATSNHHDFVTGTSPDRVAKAEQWPWITDALNATTSLRHATARALHATTSSASTTPVRVDTQPKPIDSAATDPPSGSRAAASVTRLGPLVTVSVGSIIAEFDESRGGALVEFTDSASVSRVVAPSLGLISYRERGGLWRMGNEFPGGRWEGVDRSVSHPATVDVTVLEAGARISISARLEGRPANIVVEVHSLRPGIVVHTMLEPRLWRTVTVAMHAPHPITGLSMHQPGGMVDRPLHHRFTPTFWPLHSFAATRVSGNSSGTSTLVVATAVPTSISAAPTGEVEVIVARNAPRELAYGFFPLLGPAAGHESGAHRGDVAFGWSGSGSGTQVATGRSLWSAVDRAAGRPRPEWAVSCSDDRIEVISVKPADRGTGIIVRLRNWSPRDGSRPVVVALIPELDAQVTAGWRTDSLERDLEPLSIHEGAAHLDVSQYLTTLRLHTSPNVGPLEEA